MPECSISVSINVPAAPTDVNYFAGDPVDSTQVIPAYTITALDRFSNPVTCDAFSWTTTLLKTDGSALPSFISHSPTTLDPSGATTMSIVTSTVSNAGTYNL